MLRLGEDGEDGLECLARFIGGDPFYQCGDLGFAVFFQRIRETGGEREGAGHIAGDGFFREAAGFLERFDLRFHRIRRCAVAGGGLAGFFQLLSEKYDFLAVELKKGGELGFSRFPVRAFLGFQGLRVHDLGNRLAQGGDRGVRLFGVRSESGEQEGKESALHG